jgi:hypothetical protein
VYIILKNIKRACTKSDRVYLAKDRKITARLVRGDLNIYINDSIDIKNKRLRMCDTISNNIFERLMLPSLEALMEDELE